MTMKSIMSVIDDLYKASVDKIESDYESDMKHEQLFFEKRMKMLDDKKRDSLAELKVRFGYIDTNDKA